jgi:PhnB protein
MSHATITPSLAVGDAAGAIDFYQRAFGAAEVARVTDPDGSVVFAELAIGDGRIALKDEEPAYGDVSPTTLGGTTVRLALQVPDVDALTSRAVAAGATVLIPVADREYGFRDGRLADPFGHIWIVQTPLPVGD